MANHIYITASLAKLNLRERLKIKTSALKNKIPGLSSVIKYLDQELVASMYTEDKSGRLL